MTSRQQDYHNGGEHREDDEERPLLPPPTKEQSTTSTTGDDKVNKDGTAPPQQPLYQPQQMDLEAEEGEPLNVSTNVLLIFRLQEMRQSATTNLWLALSCLVYCGINLALLYVNYVNARVSAKGHDDDPDTPVSKLAFHLIEFWATFGFVVVECLSLINTPKSLHRIYGGGDGRDVLVFKLILFFNIVASFLPAFLITLNLNYFEIISHEIEYLNELTMTFVDLVLFFSLTDLSPKSATNSNNKISGNSGNDGDDSNRTMQMIMIWISICVVVIQLGVYNLMGRDPDDGCMNGEVLAHYLEFGFEIVSSLIAFWFCMDNKFVADKEIGLILYGLHRDCRICGASSQDFFREYTTTATSKNIHQQPPQPPPNNDNHHHHHHHHPPPSNDQYYYSPSMCTPSKCKNGKECGNTRSNTSRQQRLSSYDNSSSLSYAAATAATSAISSYGSLDAEGGILG